MFKNLWKLILLSTGMLTIFISCADDKKDDTPPAEAKDFIEFAAMEGYANPIINGMKVNLADDSKDATSGDILDNADNKTIFYTYVDQPDKFDNTRAVYRAGANGFMGVEIIGTGTDKQLRFIFNKSEENVSEFFESVKAVNFDITKTTTTIPEVIDNFINLSAGGGYKFLDDEPFFISGDDMVDDDNHIHFTFNNYLGDNKTHAVYQSASAVNPNQFIGVILVSDASPRVLDFYVDGTASNPTYFPKAEDVNFDNKATDKLPVKSYLDNVAYKLFQLIINYQGMLSLIGFNGDIESYGTVYKYNKSDSPLTAVYQVEGKSEYFGAKMNEADLDFYFSNSRDNPVYWTTPEAVKFVESADTILATRTLNGSFLNGVPSDNVTTIETEVPTDGVISAQYKNDIVYILADNKTSGDRGTLYKGIADEVGVIGSSSQVATNAVVNIRSDSLQVIDKTPYIISQDSGNIKMFDEAGVVIDVGDGHVSSFAGVLYAIGAEFSNGFYLASNNLTKTEAKVRKVTAAGMNNYSIVALANSNLVPTSVVKIGDDVYVAGDVGEDVIVNRVVTTSNTVTEFATVTGTDGKLFVFNNTLYLVVTDTSTKMYKLLNNGSFLVTGATLPVEFEAITADDKYVYITSRLFHGIPLKPIAYTLNDTVLNKIAEGVVITVVSSVTPSLVSLGSDLGIVIFDVETIDGKNLLRYHHLKVFDTPFTMPVSVY